MVGEPQHAILVAAVLRTAPVGYRQKRSATSVRATASSPVILPRSTAIMHRRKKAHCYHGCLLGGTLKRLVAGLLLIAITVSGCGRIGFDSLDKGADGAGETTARIALVQSTAGWSSSRVTSRSVTLNTAPKMGDLMIVAVSTSFTIPVSVTDSAGNTYQGVSSNPTANSDPYCNILLYYARNVTTTDTFTATVTTGPGNDYLSVVVLEVAGTDPVAPLADNVRSAGMNASPMAGPIQSARDEALYFALLCHNGTRTTTMGPGYQVLEIPTEAGATNSAIVTAYKLGDAHPTDVNAMMSGADSWQMMLAAFE